LVYKRNRYYDPASGRFTSQDPLGLGGGLNVYGFAGGDPVNEDDPFGLCIGESPLQEQANKVQNGTEHCNSLFAFVIGSTGASISAIKSTLKEVFKKLGIEGPLPKMSPGKWGSPQRGSSKLGYRLDPAHPDRAADDPESGPHINWWDWRSGKKGSGGKKGAEPIREPEVPKPKDVPIEDLPIDIF